MKFKKLKAKTNFWSADFKILMQKQQLISRIVFKGISIYKMSVVIS
jgi:hypothetical protein